MILFFLNQFFLLFLSENRFKWTSNTYVRSIYKIYLFYFKVKAYALVSINERELENNFLYGAPLLMGLVVFYSIRTMIGISGGGFQVAHRDFVT